MRKGDVRACSICTNSSSFNKRRYAGTYHTRVTSDPDKGQRCGDFKSAIKYRRNRFETNATTAKQAPLDDNGTQLGAYKQLEKA